MTASTPLQLTDLQGLPIEAEYFLNQDSPSVVILVHGFGVRRDSHGKFLQMAEVLLPEHTVVLFDLNPPLDEQNRQLVLPVRRQAERLEAVITWSRKQFPGKITSIVTHSLGGVITSLATTQNLAQVILLAPPHQATYQRIIENFSRRPGAILDEDGVSGFPRSDGSITIVEADFWPDIKQIQPPQLYQALSLRVPTTIVYAAQDDVLQNEEELRLSPQKKLDVLEIPGDHSFSGADRPKLLTLVQELLHKQASEDHSPNA